MSKKRFYKFLYLKILPTFIFGFVLGVIAIWPGIVFERSRNCFFNILKDGIDGDVQLKTMVSINPNYLLKIKNSKNIYLKVLFIGDSCFR